MADQTQQITISDIMSGFGSNSDGDEEILKIASDYALQLYPAQIATIMKLKTFAIDYPSVKPKIKEFLEEYLRLKKFHESAPFIMRALDSISLKKVIPNDAVKVNVMKQ